MIGRTNAGGSGGGGGGSELIIIGGTTSPAKATHNTVWVNTDIEITSFYLSAAAPENITEGMVLLTIGERGRNKILAPVGDNWVSVYTLSAKQYINGEFVDREAKTFQNGTWVNWTVFAFNNGNLCEELTGGWKATDRNWYEYGQVMATMEVDNGRLTVKSYFNLDSNNFGGTVQTINKIDMTPYTAVVFHVVDCGLLNSSSGYGLVGKYRLGVTSDVTSKTYTMDAYVDLEENGVNGEISVDVSAINKPCAVAINPTTKGKAGSTAYVTVDWIELVS